MPYFKHQELVEKYHVSLKTVHNWIDASKQGKLELKLHTQGGRTYISDDSLNVSAIEDLVKQGKKYRNARYHKVIHPTADFYKIYSRRQILDIITNLEAHSEIPSKYSYFEAGAEYWDDWIKHLAKDKVPGMVWGSWELIRTNTSVITGLLDGAKKVNVIDLGPGNAYPVKELLGTLVEMGVLNRYIGIDISQAMLDIAERNIKKWFGGKVRFEGHVRDISYERFDDLLVDDMLDADAEQTVNLALLLGGTQFNLRSPSDMLRIVRGSMGRNDILIQSDKPDTETARRYFSFGTGAAASRLSPRDQYAVSLLGIDESLYEPEMGFDSELRMRYIRIRLKTAITIKFRFGTAERTVTLEKGSTILLLRIWHLTAREIVSLHEQVGFTMLQTSLTKGRDYLLTISGIGDRHEREF